MDAYIYQAALYCEDCAMKHLTPHDYDSDEDIPQGPYADGGGEADCPQHCDSCGVFLENPLTSDGSHYVYEKLWNYPANGGDVATLYEWGDFYGIRMPDALHVAWRKLIDYDGIPLDVDITVPHGWAHTGDAD